jgi:hypothetical protein
LIQSSAAASTIREAFSPIMIDGALVVRRETGKE